jgi:lipid II:glycine glycyltransferase (peptidoglycan interpeptide bridge formation enzyme)
VDSSAASGSLVQIEHSQHWAQLAADFRDLNYRHGWSYGKTSAERFGAQIEHVAIQDGCETIGLAAVRVKTVPLLKTGIAYVGGGPLTRRGRPEDLQALESCLAALREEYLVRRGLTLRILPPLQPEQSGHDAVAEVYRNLGFTDSSWPPPYHTVMVDLRRSVDEIRKKLLQKWRNCLNSAEKQGMTVQDSSEPDAFHAFESLFNQFLDRKNISVDLTAEFFSMVRSRSEHDEGMLISIAMKDGQPVAGLLTSMLGDTAVSLLGANGNLGLKHKAANLLQWHVMMRAKERGMHWYDPGGIEPETNPGVYHFKSGLGGHEISTPGPFQDAPAGMRGSLMPSAEKFYRWTRRFAKWT